MIIDNWIEQPSVKAKWINESINRFVHLKLRFFIYVLWVNNLGFSKTIFRCCCFFFFLVSIPAIIFGYSVAMTLRRINQNKLVLSRHIHTGHIHTIFICNYTECIFNLVAFCFSLSFIRVRSRWHLDEAIPLCIIRCTEQCSSQRQQQNEQGSRSPEWMNK